MAHISFRPQSKEVQLAAPKKARKTKDALAAHSFTLITPDPPVNAATNKAIAKIALVLPCCPRLQKQAAGSRQTALGMGVD